MAFIEKTLSSKLVYDGPIFKIRKHEVTSVNGRIAVRDVLEHDGASVILAVKDNGKILMVKQYRKAIDKVFLELPAGKIDKGENPQDAAIRELREETGYTAKTIKYITEVYPSAGYSQEVQYIYLCRDLTAGETEFDDTEDIDLCEYDPKELYRMIINNEIIDSKTVIGVLMAKEMKLI